MPAFQLEATADSATNNAWTQGGGSAKWSNVADSNDATDIRSNASNRQGFVMQDVAAEAQSIAGDVNLYFRLSMGTDSTSTAKASFRSGGVNYDHGTSRNPDTSWHDYDNLYPDLGGAPWTPALLNGAEMGIVQAFVANTMLCSKMNVKGTYLTAPGGFAFLIVSLAGMMLGANLMMSHMPMIAGAVATMHRPGEGISIIQPHEFPRALAELKAHPFRRYFL